MPIYEFYCDPCNTLFNFFSRTINTKAQPRCPRCKTQILSRRMSTFAVAGRAKEDRDSDDLPFDASKVEKAMQMLTGEAEKINDDDPRQTADLMRKMTRMTGLELGAGMQEALRRMENGEDPEQIEADMGELLVNEDPFLVASKRGGAGGKRAPRRDETLYDL